MLPIGPLMIEHRLIDRMIALVADAAARARATDAIDPVFIDAVVDFVRVYADRSHHGKEEDVLFRDLATKPLDGEDRRTMDRLIDDHKRSRRIVAEMEAANAAFRDGAPGASGTIAATLAALVDLYPGHIALEDKTFFPAAMTYLSAVEKDAMLAEMRSFDEKEPYHERYARMVGDLEGASGRPGT
jgi:hemerythrin-like domain-containing protein